MVDIGKQLNQVWDNQVWDAGHGAGAIGTVVILPVGHGSWEFGHHRWTNIIKYQCIQNVSIIHFFGVNELDYVRKQQYGW